MVDIVEKLRKLASECYVGSRGHDWSTEAADAIENLRAVQEDLRRESSDLVSAQYAISALCQALKPFTFLGLRFDFSRWDDETKVYVRLPSSSKRSAAETWILTQDIVRAREVFESITNGIGAAYDEE